MDIKGINASLQDKSPKEIVAWAIQHAKKPVITTNFRPYESTILHLTTKVLPTLKVIWCDTGYNTAATYRHAKELIEMLNLNIHIYVPQDRKSVV